MKFRHIAVSNFIIVSYFTFTFIFLIKGLIQFYNPN